MDQIRVNTSTKTIVNSTNTKKLVKSINLDHIKYPGPYQYHNWDKASLGVDSTTKV